MPESPAVPEAEAWFLAHGLSYFVPGVRADVREGLRARRFLPALLVVVLVATGAAVLLVWALEEWTAAPAVLVSFAAGGALLYALTALRARRIVVWALGRTFGSLRLLVPMASRALPLLLVFVTFLFINAEAWQMTANLQPGVLWLTVLLLATLAVVFLMVRLPEEVDQVDDAVDAAFVERTTQGTPLADPARRLLAGGLDPAQHAQVTGYDRLNLILVLLVVQVGQIVLLAVSVFVFFLLFGALVMNVDVQASWTGFDGSADADGRTIDSFSFLPNVSVQLLQVSLFLAAFSGLYFTVAAVTDDTYRGQFFGAVTEELERAVGMRVVYLALRAEADSGLHTGAG